MKAIRVDDVEKGGEAWRDGLDYLLRFCGEDGSRADSDDAADDNSDEDGDSDEVNPQPPHNKMSSKSST